MVYCWVKLTLLYTSITVALQKYYYHTTQGIAILKLPVRVWVESAYTMPRVWLEYAYRYSGGRCTLNSSAIAGQLFCLVKFSADCVGFQEVYLQGR